MNSFLLNRQLGSISPQALATAQHERLIRSLQAAPDVRFSLEETRRNVGVARHASGARSVAHAAGVNSIAIDTFDGRYLLSGGADSSVAIWDLEADAAAHGQPVGHEPLSYVANTATSGRLGITHISFYPFDSLAFTTSSYDHTLKLHSSETLATSATFDLGSVVYSHACSPGLLVACATQHPAVRLIDLRSGAGTHSLAGHVGAVLTVAWKPGDENILASGATDGVVRLWDIRRSASSLGVLDLQDSVGIVGYDGRGTGARRRERGETHSGAVNGVVWTDDAFYLVSVGHDEKMRVWDMVMGANTLVNFGPAIKNSQTSSLLPLISPAHLTPPGKGLIYYPNPKEVLSFELHTGALLSRLRAPTTAFAPPDLDRGGVRNVKTRTTSLAWRAHDVELYSAHSDGTIRCWRPRTWEDVLGEKEEQEEAEAGDVASKERKRKRDELDGIVRDLTSKRVTYT